MPTLAAIATAIPAHSLVMRTPPGTPTEYWGIPDRKGRCVSRARAGASRQRDAADAAEHLGPLLHVAGVHPAERRRDHLGHRGRLLGQRGRGLARRRLLLPGRLDLVAVHVEVVARVGVAVGRGGGGDRDAAPAEAPAD